MNAESVKEMFSKQFKVPVSRITILDLNGKMSTEKTKRYQVRVEYKDSPWQTYVIELTCNLI